MNEYLHETDYDFDLFAARVRRETGHACRRCTPHHWQVLCRPLVNYYPTTGTVHVQFEERGARMNGEDSAVAAAKDGKPFYNWSKEIEGS